MAHHPFYGLNQTVKDAHSVVHVFHDKKGVMMGWNSASHINIDDKLSNAQAVIDEYEIGKNEASALLSHSRSLAGTIFYSIKRNPSASEASQALGRELINQIVDANSWLQAASKHYNAELSNVLHAKNQLSTISEELGKGRGYRSGNLSGSKLLNQAAIVEASINSSRNITNGLSIERGLTAPMTIQRGSSILATVAERLQNNR